LQLKTQLAITITTIPHATFSKGRH
jgi:hypothetical protein